MTAHDLRRIDAPDPELVFADLLAAIEGLPPAERGAAALSFAAQLTEFAAYEIARSDQPGAVSDLILTSARLMALSQRLTRDAG